MERRSKMFYFSKAVKNLVGDEESGPDEIHDSFKRLSLL